MLRGCTDRPKRSSTNPDSAGARKDEMEAFFAPDGKHVYFAPYDEGLDVRIWQVEIADGTRIQLDGEWHRKTWVEVDDQGNVICRYGSDGHIIAEEVALSSPITVTKVG